MKKNMGIVDRIIRVIIALVLIVLYGMNMFTGVIETVLLILAGIFILTSLVSFCPLYFPFGIKTNSGKK